jgi:YebC/PmpR family DNA-binding regulatory protein
MAGHSKWANIRHRKGAQDAKRGKIFAKLIKEITVAVKTGGGGDPDFNPKLRTAISNARGQNMPKDTIDRAVKKAAGGEGGDFTETTFEGYGPDGVGVFVECATDNNQRTVGNVRSYFNKFNGSLGKDGCLEFIFERKGIFIVEDEGLDEDEFTMDMIDGGAEDVEFEVGVVTITTSLEDFGNLQKKLDELKIEPKEAGLQRIPTTMKEITKEHFSTFMKLIDALEDDDDVQKVYHNVEFDESFMNEA